MSVKSIITSVSADPSIPFSPAVGRYYKVSLADGQCVSVCDDELLEQFKQYRKLSQKLGMNADPAVLVGLELDLSHLMPA